MVLPILPQKDWPTLYSLLSPSSLPSLPQFFQRPQIQPPRATIQNSSPSIRPGAQTPTAVYQTNQHIMMVNHLPMPYPMPQAPQYCIPQVQMPFPSTLEAAKQPLSGFSPCLLQHQERERERCNAQCVFRPQPSPLQSICSTLVSKVLSDSVKSNSQKMQ